MAKKNKTRNKLAVLDFETDPFLFGREPMPFCAGVYDGEYYQFFWGMDCPEMVAEYIKEELQGYTIYAHNGGKFDFFFLLPYLDEELKIINGRIAQCSIGTAILTDSYLLLPLPLSAHKKDKFDYDKMEVKNREKYKPEILVYLKSDCIYLYEWVKKFIDRFGKKLTVAGTAFDQLKKTGYNIKSSNETYDDIFRPFYFGGRVQCFEVGEILGDYKYMDITSAYPYAMLLDHPYESKYYEKRVIPDTDQGSYFAEIDAISYGALPLRDIDYKLQFYNDDTIRKYFVSGWEIIAGLETGTLKIKKVRRIYQHTQTKNFEDYVYKFFEEKKKAEKGSDEETFAKLMLNSCYGKFGQNGRLFKNFVLTDSVHVPEDFEETENGYNWQLYSIHETGYKIWQQDAPIDRFFNVATAASITGYVRAYLWKTICESESPIYCDTDSLICKNFAGELGDNLGQWKLENKLDRLYIGGRKFYAIRDKKTKEYKTACKGGRLTSEQIVKEVKKGGGVIWRKEAPAYSLKYGARFLERKISRQF